MEYQHTKRIFRSPFYVCFKKHYCPDCHAKLKTIKVSEIKNSMSSDDEEFDFQNVDTYMVGNVKFIWTEFLCPKCGRQMSIDEMKRIKGVR